MMYKSRLVEGSWSWALGFVLTEVDGGIQPQYPPLGRTFSIWLCYTMTPSQISSKRKPALFFLCAFSVLTFPPTLTLSIATTGSELQNYKEA